MSLAERTQKEMLTGTFLRGDPITGDRYYSQEFMKQEWEHMWTRVWHIGGLVSQLPEPGCAITHSIGHESILMVRGDDQVIRAYYNVCAHRGNRLIDAEESRQARIVCGYHHWTYSLDGVLKGVRHEEDFPQGNPKGKVRLSEIRCETFGGLVWFNMDQNAHSLRDSLGVVADQLEAYAMNDMVRVMYLTAEVNCNWKIIQDNFNEAYHVPSLHRELATHIDDSYLNTGFEVYKSGHTKMMMKGALPAANSRKKVEAPLDAIMQAWDLNPRDYDGRVGEVREAIQRQKRKLGPQRGYRHYEKLADDQMTDYHHYTLFPNISLTMHPDGYQVLRPQPHPTDPEKCLFDHWYFVVKLDGVEEVETPVGAHPVKPAAHEVFKHGEKSLGFVADQDLSIAVNQQLGLHSRGYKDAYLSGQEDRVRRYHEVINDYLEQRI